VVDEDTREAINTLFVLRNILAHGTAIIQPSEIMNDDMKDTTWQRKVHRARVYLTKIFGHDDVLDNLAEYDFPAHFLDMTKDYFADVEKAVSPVPERASETLELFNKYTFGFIHHSR
jgi:hypothetical protein